MNQKTIMKKPFQNKKGIWKRKNKQNRERNLSTLWFFIKKHKLYFTFIVFLALLAGMADALTIAVIYPIISNVLASTAEMPSNTILNIIDPFVNLLPIQDELIRYSVFFLFTSIFVFIAKTIYYFLSIKFSSELVKESKQAIFNKCLNADYQFFLDNKQGEILYITSQAPNQVATTLQSIFELFVEIFLTIAVFAALFTMSWKIVLFAVAGGIVYFYFIKHLSTSVSYTSGKGKRDAGKKERVIVNEYTSGVKQIKVFETFNYWGGMFDTVVESFWKHHRRNFFWNKMPEVILWLIIYGAIGGSIIAIKLFYPGQFLSLAPLLGTFAFGLFRVIPKISKFGTLRMRFMHGMADVEAVYDLLNEKQYSTIKNGTRKFDQLEKGIQFKHVSFSHKEREKLLSNMSFNIPKDKTTALVGPSGSGKSTIINLLLRLFDVDEGKVLVDDINIKEYDVFSLRSKIGFVSQETFIFNGTVRDNISFGQKYSDDEIVYAAKQANAHEFISRLPEGFDTIVGDRGMRLSGGEQQRIAIARAMIRKPEILLLDEATSSLDNVSERMVQDAIDEVSQNCTTFVIAHRLSTIKNADVIHVLSDGKIVESGNHDELLSQKGEYYKLYQLQQR